jgi:hypothetical protein
VASTIRNVREDAVAVLGRVVLGTAGVLLLLVSLVAGGVAAWASAVFGSDGVLRLDAGTITPAPGTIATVIDVDRFSATVPYVGDLGTTSLSVSSGDAGDPSDTMFVGAAGTPAVDAYLRGTPYSVAIREGDSWTVRAVPGASEPALPREQDLWITDDVGRRAAIQVPQERPLTLVLMHPSAIPSSQLALAVDFAVPGVMTWVAWLLGGAAVLLVAGAVLLVLALRRPRRAGRHAAGAAPAAGSEVGDDALVG